MTLGPLYNAGIPFYIIFIWYHLFPFYYLTPVPLQILPAEGYLALPFMCRNYTNLLLWPGSFTLLSHILFSAKFKGFLRVSKQSNPNSTLFKAFTTPERSFLPNVQKNIHCNEKTQDKIPVLILKLILTMVKILSYNVSLCFSFLKMTESTPNERLLQ